MWLSNDSYKNWVAPDMMDPHRATCKPCGKTFNIAAMGESALKSHMKSAKHSGVMKAAAGSAVLNYLAPRTDERHASTSERPTHAVSSQAMDLEGACKTYEMVTDAEILWTLKLACYNINVRAVSDLQDGLQLLKLLSTVNPSASIDNFNPGKTFSSIKKQLCGHHACLRARFLFLGVANKSKCNVHFAITTILALSVLALQATSCSPTIEVAPLKLRKTAQCCIIDFIEIVSASDDVLDNLAAYLKASYVEHLSSAKVKRRKNESFTTRLSEAPTPNKRNSISPQQQILVAAKSDLEREIAAVKKERDDLTASLSSQQSTKSGAVNKVAEQRRK
ncbi:hypothetical protein HPB49_019132 [Dermacentor silvarum]|uniref:Uncharacterized protein n=1 Tax=Dermacentor silvarum TaxID=543639 RepID=A0ACB8E2G5_DERSI|nr:hypothetical protein HPB49_019132 [Dermacentor silvarum]